MYGANFPPCEIPKQAYDPDQSYIANLSRGPILLTAPHSIVCFRGGGFMGHNLRTHKREHWASTIVLKLAHAISELQKTEKTKTGCNYVVWNKDLAGVKKEQIIDPNYIIQSQFKHSAFHKSLHLHMMRN